MLEIINQAPTNREENFGHFFTKLNLDLDLKLFFSKLDLKLTKLLMIPICYKVSTKPDDFNF